MYAGRGRYTCVWLLVCVYRDVAKGEDMFGVHVDGREQWVRVCMLHASVGTHFCGCGCMRTCPKQMCLSP